MTTRRSLLVGPALAGLLLGGCRSESRPPEAPLPSAASPTPARAVATAAEPASDRHAGAVGVLLPRDAADVAAETDGVLETVSVRPGDRVRRGDVIARVDTRLLRQDLEMARAALSAAEAERDKAATELAESEQKNARRQALTDILSKEDLAASESERRTAAATLEVARARVAQERARVAQLAAGLGRAEIRAPFEGTVALRYLDPGARVAPGAPVARLLSSGDLMVRFAVSPAERALLAPGRPVTVMIESAAAGVPATIQQISPEIDAASQMIFVEARLDPAAAKAELLQSGMVARVRVDGAAAPEPSGS